MKVIVKNMRAHAIAGLSFACYDSFVYQEAGKTILYSTDITSRNPGATWVIVWPNRYVVGFDIKDVDTDGIEELIVLLYKPLATILREDGQVVIVNSVTGEIESDTTYTVWKDNMP